MMAAAKGIKVGRDYLDSSGGTAPPRLPPNWDRVPDKEDEDDTGLLDFDEFKKFCQDAAASYCHPTVKGHAEPTAELTEDEDGYRVRVSMTIAGTRHNGTETVTYADATEEEARQVVERLATSLVDHV